MQTTINSKGQVTIPRDVRQYFGLQQGAASGFGLIRSGRQSVPVDFDVASLDIAAP